MALADDESENNTFLSDVHVAVNPDEYRDRLLENVSCCRIANSITCQFAGQALASYPGSHHKSWGS